MLFDKYLHEEAILHQKTGYCKKTEQVKRNQTFHVPSVSCCKLRTYGKTDCRTVSYAGLTRQFTDRQVRLLGVRDHMLVYLLFLAAVAGKVCPYDTIRSADIHSKMSRIPSDFISARKRNEYNSSIKTRS